MKVNEDTNKRTKHALIFVSGEVNRASPCGFCMNKEANQIESNSISQNVL